LRATPHATPAGGAIRVFATPGKANTGKIVITGAIGDFGTTINTNKAGKPNPTATTSRSSFTRAGSWSTRSRSTRS
jgi:hypothetical protein